MQCRTPPPSENAERRSRRPRNGRQLMRRSSKNSRTLRLRGSGSRSGHQMHTADAERVIREFPHEWSRFPTANAAPTPDAQPTPLDRLGDLERDLRDLQARLTEARREITGR